MTQMLPPAVEQLIALAIEEDLGRGDVTSELLFEPSARVRGRIVAKQPLVVAGVEVAGAVFTRVDAATRFAPGLFDGDSVERGAEVAVVAGTARAVLGAERTALNFLGRLSGVATLTRRFVEAVAGTGAVVCDTRKTAPGFRLLEKRAVRAGGGANHRADLASGILIKDNHIAAAGSVKEAVERARVGAPHTLRIEVEVTGVEQIEEALAAGAEVLLLDNMELAQVQAAVQLVRRRAVIEVSGGVRLETVRALAEAGVDRISVGALTHSAPVADLSLELDGMHA